MPRQSTSPSPQPSVGAQHAAPAHRHPRASSPSSNTSFQCPRPTNRKLPSPYKGEGPGMGLLPTLLILLILLTACAPATPAPTPTTTATPAITPTPSATAASDFNLIAPLKPIKPTRTPEPFILPPLALIHPSSAGQLTLFLQIPAHTDILTGLAFSPNAPILATASRDGKVTYWDTETWYAIRTWKADRGEGIEHLAFSPDGKSLASLGGQVNLWEVPSGRIKRSLGGATFSWQLAFSPDGKFLAAAGGVRAVIIRDLATGSVVQMLFGHEGSHGAGWVTEVAFSPTGKVLASSASRETILWDTNTWQEIQRLPRIAGVTFSPDGKYLLGSDRYGINIYVGASGQLIRWIREIPHPLGCLAFSPDGKLLAIGSYDGFVMLFDATTWKHLASFPGHADPVYRLAFSPDGKLLASGSYDGMVLIWGITQLDKTP